MINKTLITLTIVATIYISVSSAKTILVEVEDDYEQPLPTPKGKHATKATPVAYEPVVESYEPVGSGYQPQGGLYGAPQPSYGGGYTTGHRFPNYKHNLYIAPPPFSGDSSWDGYLPSTQLKPNAGGVKASVVPSFNTNYLAPAGHYGLGFGSHGHGPTYKSYLHSDEGEYGKDQNVDVYAPSYQSTGYGSGYAAPSGKGKGGKRTHVEYEKVVEYIPVETTYEVEYEDDDDYSAPTTGYAPVSSGYAPVSSGYAPVSSGYGSTAPSYTSGHRFPNYKHNLYIAPPPFSGDSSWDGYLPSTQLKPNAGGIKGKPVPTFNTDYLAPAGHYGLGFGSHGHGPTYKSYIHNWGDEKYEPTYPDYKPDLADSYMAPQKSTY